MRIGARGSDLAQVQARMIEGRLNSAGIETELIIISTHGDRVVDVPLNQLGAQGVFVKEIEDALLEFRIDLAVHSFKDVASVQPDGLEIIAVTEREDCADLLIIRHEHFLDNDDFIPLPGNSVVGTSAVRRTAQILAHKPNVEVRDLRGNVPTRIGKLRQGVFDAIFLAAAGVNRLAINLSEFQVVRLDPARFVPSPGQGALAIEMREDDPLKTRIKSLLHHEETAAATIIERNLLRKFGGGCSLPLGARAFKDGQMWTLEAFWGGGDRPVWMTLSDYDSSEIVDRAFDALRKS